MGAPRKMPPRKTPQCQDAGCALVARISNHMFGIRQIRFQLIATRQFWSPSSY